jgi:hypothetical protein
MHSTRDFFPLNVREDESFDAWEMNEFLLLFGCVIMFGVLKFDY